MCDCVCVCEHHVYQSLGYCVLLRCDSTPSSTLSVSLLQRGKSNQQQKPIKKSSLFQLWIIHQHRRYHQHFNIITISKHHRQRRIESGSSWCYRFHSSLSPMTSLTISLAFERVCFTRHRCLQTMLVLLGVLVAVVPLLLSNGKWIELKATKICNSQSE